MYAAIVFLPIIGSVIAGLLGRVIGARASEIVTTGLLFVSAALSIVAFNDVALQGHHYIIQIMPWIHSGDFAVDWTIRVDGITAVMLVVVTGVSSLVHLYSIGYMAEDPHRPRFFSFLSLFTFAMLMLVTANNFLQLFFGWEGVGLASYLLIGFWYTRPSANAAAIKAFIVNRVGDFGFALGIFGIYAVFKTLDFDAVFHGAAAMAGKQFIFAGHNVDILTTLCLLLFVGAMGKSAQIGLHTWLPDAMEGPTPVSALIHAATMVTAGVYMVCLLSPMFEYAPVAKDLVTLIGAITCLFAATVGLAQNDIKRVIAYSTCSQLGYMFFAAGVGAYPAAMFHLFTHAFFKALLFLGAGAVIEAMHHEQDMRKMGALRKLLPVTYAVMLIGTLSITGVGLPRIDLGFSGFYSKDAIINAAFVAGQANPISYFAFVAGLLGAGLTSFYSWRLIFMTFHGHAKWADRAHGEAHARGARIEIHDEPLADHDGRRHGHDLEPHESPWVMLVPLLLLSVGAVAAGGVFADLFIGAEHGEFWRGVLFSLPGHVAAGHGVALPAWVLWGPLTVTAIGLFAAWYAYVRHEGMGARIAARGGLLWRFLYNKWYFDEIYDVLFVRPAKALGDLFWKGGDKAVIDGLGPDGVAAVSHVIGKAAGRLQTGYVYHYAFVMLLGIAGLLSYALWAFS